MQERRIEVLVELDLAAPLAGARIHREVVRLQDDRLVLLRVPLPHAVLAPDASGGFACARKLARGDPHALLRVDTRLVRHARRKRPRLDVERNVLRVPVAERKALERRGVVADVQVRLVAPPVEGVQVDVAAVRLIHQVKAGQRRARAERLGELCKRLDVRCLQKVLDVFRLRTARMVGLQAEVRRKRPAAPEERRHGRRGHFLVAGWPVERAGRLLLARRRHTGECFAARVGDQRRSRRVQPARVEAGGFERPPRRTTATTQPAPYVLVRAHDAL